MDILTSSFFNMDSVCVLGGGCWGWHRAFTALTEAPFLVPGDQELRAIGCCQEAEPVGPQANASDAGACPAELDQDCV